ncbi:thioesterase family protein [Nocardia sp. NBC_00565]|uniref:acyl-CoA thioesterase n=1 Tax=Nocardia sp. NBC_00565 TaxID=2975993 RepID=UPI002E803071|nr:acyl-CoA thioesterase domain-containing protein [Nocardia sp. NBC_00565]WUC07847.1 thioesterase family protein [Nocardia sp. NBC_00565]
MAEDVHGRKVLPVANRSADRVFGGQILAQLVAAAAPPDSTKSVKSIQVAFPRSARSHDALILDLETTHEGRSLGHRRAVVWQNDDGNRRITATASILVDRPDDGPEYQFTTVAADDDPQTARPVDFLVVPGESRLISQIGLDDDRAVPAELAFWMRCPDFTDQSLARPVIAYISDWPLIGTLLKAIPGFSQKDAHVQLQTDVIAHSIWFHQPFDVSEWLRVEIRGQRLVAGRGFGTGAVYTRSGSLVASFAQENVIRRAQ